MTQPTADADDRAAIPDLDRFGLDEALTVGVALLERCRAERLPVAICLHLGQQRAFHAGLPGSSADNDGWAERKTAMVQRFGVPSLDLQRRAGDDPLRFLTAFGLSPETHFPAGGAVPIRVRGTMVGVLAVSGLKSEEDHHLAISALLDLAGKQAGR